VRCQQFRLFSRGKVASAWHLGPALNVVSPFDPGSRGEGRLLKKVCDGAGWAHSIAFLKMQRRFLCLVVKTAGGVDGFSHPVKGDVAEQLVLAEAAFYVAITICPVAKFLYNPGSQRGRGIVQA